MGNGQKKRYKISAILPNYNSTDYLADCLKSLVNQTIAFDEIIVVDDGSTDHSLEVINSFQEKYHNIKLIRHETNQGVCRTLNDGIATASGDYILFCAADDWYYPNIVNLFHKVIESCPQAKLICGDAFVTHYHSLRSFRRTLPFPKVNQFITQKEFETIAKETFVFFNGSGGMFIEKSAVLEAGGLYAKLKWHSDWLLYFIVAFTYGVYYMDELIVKIHMRKKSYSEGKYQWKAQKDVLAEVIDVIQSHNLSSSFKEAGLLPRYSPTYIILFLFQRKMRPYLSLRLIKRMLIHNSLIIRIARITPYPLVIKIRKLLRA